MAWSAHGPPAGTNRLASSCRGMIHITWRNLMKLRFAVIAATAAMIGTAMPAFAEEVGVGVGPVGVGVTVGEGHRDRDVVREREVVRDRGDRRDHDTVIIKK